MARARLSPEEREARRKARSAFTFSDAAYKHYNPAEEGFGSFEEWAEIAKQIAAEMVLPNAPVFDKNTDIRIFQPNYAPKTRTELMADFRVAARATHPDCGGDAASFRRVVEICDRIKRRKGW